MLFGRKAMTNLDSISKSRDRDFTLSTKVPVVKVMFFSVVIYRYESWTIKKAECQRLMLSNCVAGEDSWVSLGQQGDQTSQSYRKSNLNIHWKDWCWSSNTWTLDVKGQLIGKDPDAGKDWGQEEKGMTEDEIVWGHHRLNGHEFEQTLGDSEGQGNPACYNPWSLKELDMT